MRRSLKSAKSRVPPNRPEMPFLFPLDRPTPGVTVSGKGDRHEWRGLKGYSGTQDRRPAGQ